MTMNADPEEKKIIEKYLKRREKIMEKYSPRVKSGMLDFPEYEEALHEETRNLKRELEELKARKSKQ